MPSTSRPEGSCAIYVAPQRPRRYAWYDGSELDIERTVLVFPSAMSETGSDHYESFLKTKSFGFFDVKVSREERRRMRSIDRSRQIDLNRLPVGKTLNQLLSEDTADLHVILTELLLLEEGQRSAGNDDASAPGWRGLSLVDMPLHGGKNITDFLWETANSHPARSQSALRVRGFRPIPHDTELVIMQQTTLDLEREFEGPDGQIQAMLFAAAHCLRPDGSIGPGCLVDLKGDGQVMSLREQLAAFETELLGSSEWKDVEADFLDLAFDERDKRILQCVEEVWKRTAETVAEALSGDI